MVSATQTIRVDIPREQAWKDVTSEDHPAWHSSNARHVSGTPTGFAVGQEQIHVWPTDQGPRMVIWSRLTSIAEGYSWQSESITPNQEWRETVTLTCTADNHTEIRVSLTALFCTRAHEQDTLKRLTQMLENNCQHIQSQYTANQQE